MCLTFLIIQNMSDDYKKTYFKIEDKNIILFRTILCGISFICCFFLMIVYFILILRCNQLQELTLQVFSLKMICFRRGISETARLSVFWVRILRFSRAKILESFLWLNAKNFKSAFRSCLCSRKSFLILSVKFDYRGFI